MALSNSGLLALALHSLSLALHSPKELYEHHLLLSIFSILQHTKNVKKEERMITENVWKATGGSSPRVARQELSIWHESYDDGLELVVVLWRVY